MLAAIGIFALMLGVVSLFSGDSDFLFTLILLAVGVLFLWVDNEDTKDKRQRHEQDYGLVARCYKCGSTKVYHMTYDDKRDSIAFWGAASSKIGMTYHCDDCGAEW